MGEGDFIKKPDRRFKLLVLTQGLWMTTLVVLALWWGTLLKQQSDEIATLQVQLGAPETDIRSRSEKTTRMVEGESGAFVLLILVTNAVLLFFYARDTRRSRSLEAFFASLTHELRTPLTSIRLQAEALQDIEDNPHHRPYLNRLLEDVGRLEGQVQQTLELARIEGGGTLALQPIRIRSFLQNKIIPQYTIQDSKLRFEVEVAEDFIHADPSALNMIFRNLIDNSLKYSSSAPTRIRFQGIASGDDYHLEVIHLNSNFSGESAKLGELFYRGRNSQGAGVGLYLISTLAAKMKGSAEFTPEESRFTCRLSLHRESEEAGHGS